jgi:hypothetical protein
LGRGEQQLIVLWILMMKSRSFWTLETYGA